jgi:uncharacterized metal-binding protein YceD (DUF177 family)
MRNKLHQFEFDIDEAFFREFEQDLVNTGSLNAKIDLEKNDSFIEMEIGLSGTVQLTCDRSLDEFQYPINETRKVIFKYGDEEMEINHDIVMITSDTQQIDVGQYIFEFVSLAVPMKKLHPRFVETDEDFGSMVYRSADPEQEENSNEPDPRWSKLNQLKKN